MKSTSHFVLKHISAVMLALFFFSVNTAAFTPETETALPEKNNTRNNDGYSTDKSAEAENKTTPYVSFIPEENNNSWDGNKYPQRLKNYESILTHKSGNGAGRTGVLKGSACRSYWQIFRLALHPDRLQSGRDIIVKFLHNKDGMK